MADNKPSKREDKSADLGRWEGRPALAFMLRAAVYTIPIVSSVLFSIWLSRTLPQAQTIFGVLGWWGAVIGGSTVVLFVVDKLARRLLPLAAMLSLTMVFPDRSPSRFRTALRSGSSVKNLKAILSEAEALGLDDSPTKAAELVLQLATALNSHDPRTRGHAERVRAYTEMLAEELGIDEADRAKLRWASLLHDIGKLKISPEILNKAGKLDDDEWMEIRKHPVFGEEICGPLLEWLGDWSGAVVDHHERYDGNGYPNGRKGEEISLAGRIVCVADAYDVMTTVRSYKEPMPTDAARQELARHAGTQFDPEVVRAFLTLSMGRLRWIAGPLSWLAQLPFLRFAGLAQNVGSSVGVAAVAAGGATAALTTGLVEVPGNDPLNLPPPPAALQRFVDDVVPTTQPPNQVVFAAVNDRFNATEDAAVALRVLDNDAASGGSIVLVQRPQNGVATVNTDGTITYIPNPDFSGTDSLTYQISDGDGATSTAVVVIEVEGVNDEPIVNDDIASVDEDGSVTIDVLANDIDPEGLDPSTLVVSLPPTNGNVTVDGGKLVYTPDPDFSGDDSFTYEVTDTGGIVAKGTVTVGVAPVNDPPIITRPIAFSVTEDDTYRFDPVAAATDPDGDVVTLAGFDRTSERGGTIVAGSLVYTPPRNYTGTDRFSYRLTDGTETVTVVVQISVQDIDHPPSPAADISPRLPEDTPTVIEILANFVDLDDDALSIARVTQPMLGTVTVNPDGTVTYAPSADVNGTDSFDVTVSDGALETTVTISVVVTAVEDAPIAVADVASFLEDGPAFSFNVLDNDTDPDGDALSVTAVDATGVTAGVLTNLGDGDFSFVPAPDLDLSQTFVYTVSDGTGRSASGVVTLAPTAVADDPMAVADDYTVAEDPPAPVSFNVLDNDLDPDTGDSITYLSHDATGIRGLLTPLGAGSFTFVPEEHFNGVEIFTYDIGDSTGRIATGTVRITVTATPDDPVAGDEAYLMDPNTVLTVPPPGLLANAYDYDALYGPHALSVKPIPVSDPVNGSVSLSGDGSFTYTPNPAFVGTDSFVYAVTDPTGRSATATATITVNAGTSPGVWYLGDSGASQSVFDLVTSPPPAGPPADPVPDIDGDGRPGLTIAKSDGKLTNSNPTDYQQWRILPSAPLELNGPVTLELWSTTPDFESGEPAHVVGYVLDCDASVPTDCVELFETDIHLGDWNGGIDGWAYREVNLGPVVHTVNTGRSLTLRLMFKHEDVWVASTVDYPSRLTVTKGNLPPATVPLDYPTDVGAANLLEDGATVNIDLLSIPSMFDADLDLPSLSIVSNGSLGTATARTDGTIDYLPTADLNGTDALTYEICDLNSSCSTGSVSVDILPINDAPSFTHSGDVTVLEDSGDYNAAFASAMSVGPPNEESDGQSAAFTVTHTNGTLFAEPPAVDDDNGNLSFRPADNAFGVSTVTVTYIDDGGTVNGGADRVSVDITITVTSQNDRPVAADDSLSVLEDETKSVAAYANDTDVEDGTPGGLPVIDTVPANGTATPMAGGFIEYDPDPDFHGTDSFTYFAVDSQGLGSLLPKTVSVTVTSVNDAPSYTAGADPVTVLEDSGAYDQPWASAISVGPANESTQIPAFVVSNDNNGLFAAQPAISATGRLTFTPADDANGSAVVTVELTDNGGTTNGGVDTTGTSTFSIDVDPVNDAPSYTAGADPVTVLEDSGAYDQPWASAISVGPANESTQIPAFVVSNDNNGLFAAQPAISATGRLTFTPADDANGSAVVTVELTDNGGTTNGGVDTTGTSTFSIDVDPVNDAPTFDDAGAVTRNEDAGAVSVAWASNPSVGPPDEVITQTLLGYSIRSNDNPGLFSVQPAIANDGTLTFTTMPNQSGSATLWVYLSDDGGTTNGGQDESADVRLDITLDPINDEPSFIAGPDVAAFDTDPLTTVTGWATAISAGPGETDGLTFNATNDNNPLFSVQPSVDASTGDLTFRPSPGMTGVATVSVQLQDDGASAPPPHDNLSNVQTFTIGVMGISTDEANIVVNEVLFRERTGFDEEFIEIHNRGAAVVDLTGWRLADGNPMFGSPLGLDFTFPATDIDANPSLLAPGTRAVVWTADQGALPEYMAPIAHLEYEALEGTQPLSNSADDIWLFDGDPLVGGDFVDFVAWGTGGDLGPPPSASHWDPVVQVALATAAPGQSISLSPNGSNNHDSSCWEPTTSGAAACGGLSTLDNDPFTDVVAGDRVSSAGAHNEVAPGPALISEVNTVDGDDFIEIYNPSSISSIDINGYEVRLNGVGVSNIIVSGPDTLIGPGEHYLITHATATLGVPADQTFAFDLPDELGIRLRAGGTMFDVLGVGANPGWSEGTALPSLMSNGGVFNQSYERLESHTSGNCTDTDDNSVDFVHNYDTYNPQSQAAGSPAVGCGPRLYSASPLAGQIVINEVLFDNILNDEFIEIYNAGSVAIDLAGWRLTDSNVIVGHTDPPVPLDYTLSALDELTAQTMLPAGGYAVVWLMDGPPVNTAPNADLQFTVGGGWALDDLADDVWLFDAAGQIADYVGYGDPTVAGGERDIPPPFVLDMWDRTGELLIDGTVTLAGQSIALTPNGLDSDTASCWEPSGTNTSACGLATMDSDPGARIASPGDRNTVPDINGVVISEFTTTTADDYIEIYNTTGASVALDGLQIYVWPGTGAAPTLLLTVADVVLPPYKHALIGNGLDIDSAGALDIDRYGGVELRDGVGTVDAVGTNGRPGGGPDEVGSGLIEGLPGEGVAPMTLGSTQAIQRKWGNGSGNCVDTDVNANDFIRIDNYDMQGLAAPPEYCGSEPAPPPASPGLNDVVISEYRSDGPAGGGDEFIEIFNPTQIDINIDGYTIEVWDGGWATVHTAGSETLKPGEHYLIASGSASLGGVLPDALYGGSLKNDGAVRIRNGVTVLDLVGHGAVPEFEGSPLPKYEGRGLATYERLAGGVYGSCVDAGDNSTDFAMRFAQEPQSLASSSAPTPCPFTAYLGTVGSGDTVATPLLPLEFSAPTEATLYNYDTDLDSFPGRVIMRGAVGSAETDLSKYQDFYIDLPSTHRFEGTAWIDVWAAMKDFDPTNGATLRAYLLECDAGGGSGCNEVASGSTTVDPLSPDGVFRRVAIQLSGAPEDMNSGKAVRIMVTADAASDDSVWFAFGTTSYSSYLLMY